LTLNLTKFKYKGEVIVVLFSLHPTFNFRMTKKQSVSGDSKKFDLALFVL
jgi:hypothetical protein